jgi:hypothetical protein
MTIPVSLRDLVGELQILPNEGTAYLNKVTGKIIMFTDDDVEMAEAYEEMEEEFEEEPEGNGGEELALEREFYQEVNRILASDADYLELPSRFEIHEYEIMERFCQSYPDGKIGDILLQKIKGAGAFRRFKDAIYEYGIEDDWFKFQNEAYKEIAIAWLDDNHVAYVDDMNQSGQNT